MCVGRYLDVFLASLGRLLGFHKVNHVHGITTSDISARIHKAEGYILPVNSLIFRL